MGRTLARSVNIMDDNGNYRTYEAGESIPDSVAKNITNPAAWDDPDNPTYDEEGGDLQVTGISQEAAKKGANANSIADSEEGSATADKSDNEDGLWDLTVPELVERAQNNQVDLDGATKKGEIIAKLREASAS